MCILCRWVKLPPVPEAPETFSVARVQSSLKAAWQAHYGRKRSSKTPRALLTVPGSVFLLLVSYFSFMLT